MNLSFPFINLKITCHRHRPGLDVSISHTGRTPPLGSVSELNINHANRSTETTHHAVTEACPITRPEIAVAPMPASFLGRPTRKLTPNYARRIAWLPIYVSNRFIDPSRELVELCGDVSDCGGACRTLTTLDGKIGKTISFASLSQSWTRSEWHLVMHLLNASGRTGGLWARLLQGPRRSVVSYTGREKPHLPCVSLYALCNRIYQTSLYRARGVEISFQMALKKERKTRKKEPLSIPGMCINFLPHNRYAHNPSALIGGLRLIGSGYSCCWHYTLATYSRAGRRFSCRLRGCELISSR